MPKPKKTYEAMPAVPAEVVERYQAVLSVLSGEMTVSDAARRLSLSRNHFQSQMHRGLAALIEGLMPRQTGRPPKPPREVELEQQNEMLRKENERLKERAEVVNRLLEATSEVVRGRVPLTGRAKKDRPAKKVTTANDSDDEGADQIARDRLFGAENLRACGIAPIVSSALVGVGASTVRRWKLRHRNGQPLVRKRGADRPRRPPPECVARVGELVRELHGVIGADSLRRTVPLVSRRQASAIKHETLSRMETERRQQAERIVITTCGVVRGFDAMHVATRGGVRYPLVAADAAVPFRTSILAVESYDGPSVASALERDFAEHGAPLVLRLDRARCHDVAEVHAVLRHHGVLVLHGPPHHPGFYGQLERQNREHRAWLDLEGLVDPGTLAALCERMKHALNTHWRRRSLDWKTAAEAWKERPLMHVDRTALRDEVCDRTARILFDNRHSTRMTQDLASRFAIETALTRRGFLQRQPGGWC